MTGDMTTHYIWDVENDSYLMETDGDGNPTAVYTNEPVPYGRLISQRRGNTTSYYHFDGQGSTRQLTDQNGNVTDTCAYDAFGVEVAKTGSTANPFGYKGALGYYTDQGTGIIDVRRRPYEPKIGRWLVPDSIGVVESINLYIYAWTNPINHSDPSGEWPLCSTGFCSIHGPKWNFEGIYGVRAELIAEPDQCCEGATIRFQWKETHALPAWYQPRAGRSGCGEPANDEFERGFLWPFRFGDIVKRGCSAPRQTKKKVNNCWVVQVDWECKVKCVGSCKCAGNCEPTSSSLGIYPNGWRDPKEEEGFSIRIDTSIKYDEAACVLSGCSLETKFGWQRRSGLPTDQPPQANCKQEDIDFLWRV